MKSWDDKVIHVQDKGSRFIVLDTNSYIEDAEHQINRSSFDKLDADPSPKFKEKVSNWLEKWSDNITAEWKESIRLHKGSRFIVLDTNSCIEEVGHQITRGSFDKHDADPSPKFKGKVNNWLEK